VPSRAVRGVGKHGSCLRSSEDGGTATKIFFISVNLSLCGIHFFQTSRDKHKNDGQILSLDSRSSNSEDDIAKTINFNHIIDEFVSVKARKITL
jgi:hypothetical protein